MRTLDTDVAVIGAGTAGLAAYRAAKAAGRRALLIEGGVYGTTCARVGCMPSKLLIAPAEAAHAVERFGAFGLAIDGPVRVDGKAVMARVRRERDRFVGFVVDGVDKLPAADKVRGYARFARRPHAARRAGGRRRADDAHRRRRASSSPPARRRAIRRPGTPSAIALVTNDEVFDWQDLPASVAVFGPGVIGLELGQALHRLGVRVKVFGRGGGVGPLFDPAIIEYARRAFGDEFYLDTDARADVSRDGDAVLVHYRALDGTSQVERFDYLLAATGRKPNVAGLDLGRTTLELDRFGVPLFDRHTMRAGTSSIFIAGDVDNEVPLLHEAADEGRIAGENAARYPDVRPGLRRAGLGVVFTDPQIAIVGGGYAEARKVHHVTGMVSFEDQGRSRVMLRNRGLLHVYAEVGHGSVPRRRDDRPRRRAHRPSARVGAADEPRHRPDARDAVLPPGHRGRPAHRAARRTG